MGQSAPSSPGAQKKPLLNRQTGQGSNIETLKRALAIAEAHLAQTSNPTTIQNIRHGVDLTKAQIARISGVDHKSFDLNSVPDSSTGYVFAGFREGTDFDGVAVSQAGVDQSPISPFAQYQLFGTLRQKITKVAPPKNATPAGSVPHPGLNPRERSNTIKTPNNPNGSGFDYGNPNTFYAGIEVHGDNRNGEYIGRPYIQGFTPNTHNLDLLNSSNGIVTSAQVGRGKHGQYKSGYSWQGEQPQNL